MNGRLAPGLFEQIRNLAHVHRWSGLPQVHTDTAAEHSFNVAILAHALAVVGRDVFGEDVDPAAVAVRALYHDAVEIIVGDVRHDVKYSSEYLRDAIRGLERAAATTLHAQLPAELAASFAVLLDNRDNRYVKAADVLDAFLKASAESALGNSAFDALRCELFARLKALAMPELEWFLAHCASTASAASHSTAR